MSSSLGVGGALGLPAAALLAQYTNWHVLFWVAAGLAVLVFVLVRAFVPESEVRSGGRFDLVGAAGLSAGLVCLLLAISKGADWGWGSGTTLTLICAAVALLLVWGWWELRTGHALVDLRVTMHRQVLLTNLSSIMLGFAMYAMSLVLPQLLQMPTATGYGLGQSMVAAGLYMGPSGLVMMAVSPLSARITAAWGAKVSLMTGAATIAVGYALGIVLMSEAWQMVIVGSVIGAGVGFAYGAVPALIMSAVPVSETASANGLNSLMRSIGTSVSAAVCGVVLAHMTTRFGDFALPSRDGFRTALIIGCAAALGALVLAAFLPGRRPAAVPAGADTGVDALPASTSAAKA
ncbi:MFS transporter [Streptomyces sp. NPDC002018]|uniref:MFS transporter n=1 Tax=Streptomyces sp. NPDC002018 TaxID=3364629 RepID=UPI003696C37B